jgi:DNA repair protein RecO (recombination protein O)
MRITLEPAFILHHRPYRETSMLLDLFSQEHGRISVVARGVRQSKSRLKSLLQAFVPILVSWQGKGELMTMLTAEPNEQPIRLTGECLFGGLYLNELLMRLLPKHDPHPQLYTIYKQTLLELQGAHLQQKTLRLFEKKLLEELGYGLQLKQDAAGKNNFAVENFYRFHPEHGFELCAEQRAIIAADFSGKSLLALAADELDDEVSLRDAKRLMRIAMAPLLGIQPLHSRKLYSQQVSLRKDDSSVNPANEVETE